MFYADGSNKDNDNRVFVDKSTISSERCDRPHANFFMFAYRVTDAYTWPESYKRANKLVQVIHSLFISNVDRETTNIDVHCLYLFKRYSMVQLNMMTVLSNSEVDLLRYFIYVK